MSLIQDRQNMLRHMGANAESDSQVASAVKGTLEQYAGDLYQWFVEANVPSLSSAVSALDNTAGDLAMLAIELRDIAKQAEAYERQLGM